ncbi:cytochrome c3 family protein [Geothrix edaphica]|uniref:Cytochrome c n=1 Tax=Geothrix edaphica TaxID=2927976 RepID=A0ABQ5Q0J8_9BACT|nr:cytochrome c3 family protein [Geothrix edaphica]GLH67826.1 cytochrome c [Geothrix edaphica]
MKSRVLLLLVATSLSLSATIAGTKHDLSSSGPGVKTNITQKCVFCHTPHGSATGTAQIIPLWNKTTTVTTGFTMYSSGTISGTVDTTPTGASMACFTCHDGTQAVGNMINLPNGVASVTYTAGGGVNATGFIASGVNLLGKDLSNDHPVSITYTQNLDSGLVNPTSFAPNTVQLFPTNANGSKVQCASCHQVHDNTNPPFLRVSMTNSALCTTCHIK